MRLSRWSTTNYRSIQSANINIGEFTALIGKNNSGKSNICESLLHYAQQIREGYASVVTEDIIRDQNDRSTVTFDATFELDHQEQEIAADYFSEQEDIDKHREELLTSGDLSLFRHRSKLSNNDSFTEQHWVNIRGKWYPYRFRLEEEPERIYSLDKSRLYTSPDRFYVSDDFEISEHSHNSAFGGVITGPYKDWHIDYVENIEQIGAIRNPEDALNISVRNDLSPDAKELPNVLHTLSQNEKEKYESIAETYVHIMEGVTDVTAPIENSQTAGPKTTIEVIEDSNSYGLDEISSGSMEILSLITKLVLSETSTTLLVIEEPELHLHPDAEREILELMKDVSQDSPQILITTHSDVFVDSTDVEQIVRVIRDESTQTRTIDSIDQELADLGYDKSGFLQANAVVFVEGKSDERVIKQLARNRGMDLNEEGIKFVELDGEGNIKSDGRSLVKLLFSFDIPYLFIADSHDKNPDTVRDDYLSHINCREGEWHTTGEHFFILSEYGIENYLVKMPEAIASSVNAPIDEVRKEIDTKRKSSEQVLNDIFEEYFDTGYHKSEHGFLIAKHASTVPNELSDLIDRIASLTVNDT